MKSFLQIIEDENKAKKPVVMAFGRMNPPTTGHMKLINKVKEIAHKQGASHKIVVSHTQDSKKNPLSGEQKLKHLKRYSPDTHFETSDKEHPTLLHHAAKLHQQGHDKLTVVGGSDRTKEYHDLLHKYNGVHGKHGYYNFKHIEVKSAGQRDPDAEGAEGMSATKMREHAKNNDIHSFKQGVPSHVSDKHAKELMHDVRKGMGLHEDVNRGRFKAIFVTGGPGSGKDVIIRETIAESRAIELNFSQAYDYLSNKHYLAETSSDYRREAIRNRNPLIINGPADDREKLDYIKEELEELGYQTIMIFVETSDLESKLRNENHKRIMAESLRKYKWMKSQENCEYYESIFENFVVFDNDGSISDKEDDLDLIYRINNAFLDMEVVNESSIDWLKNNGKLDINSHFSFTFGDNYVQESSKSIQKKTASSYNPFFRTRKEDFPLAAKRPDQVTPDNGTSEDPTGGDQIKGNTKPRKNPNGVTWTAGGGGGGAGHAVYAESSGPSIKVTPVPKEPNFQKDNDKNKRLKRGDTSSSAPRVGRPSGVGQEYDTRAGGQGAAAGAGLGNQTYSEDAIGPTASNADVIDFNAQVGGPKPNPLSNDYPQQKKSFRKFKTNIKEYNGFQNDVDSGLGGTLGGADNVEKMDSYSDRNRNLLNDYGLKLKKKKKQEK